MPRFPRIPGFEPVDEVEVADYRPIFDHPPPVVGDYQIGQKLGTGTLGPCYEAWHLRRRAPAVIKLLTIDDSVQDRLLAERALLHSLQSLAMLAHPGIVRLREAGPTDDGIFIAVEPAQGRTLDKALATGWRPDTARCVALVSEWAEALARAHAAGLVHGNLHGGNIVLDEHQRSSITDFGLLCAARGHAQLDLLHQSSVHQLCRAPEHESGSGEQPAGDTHALGMLAYRLFLDEPSFQRALARHRPGHHERRRWPALAVLRPDLPVELCTWVERALDPDPAKRPDLAAGVPQIRLATDTAAGAVPTPLAVRAPRRYTLAPGRLALLTLMFIVLAGTAGLAHKLRQTPAPDGAVQTRAPATPLDESFESAAGAGTAGAGHKAARNTGDAPRTAPIARPTLKLDR